MLFADQPVHRGANLNGAGRGRAHRRSAGGAGVPHPEALGHLPDRLSVIQPPKTGRFAEAVQLCQRLYPKTRKALPSWWAYALALLLSGLGVLAQWLFGLVLGDLHFVMAVAASACRSYAR